jgi:four helix bundle protein
MRREGEFDHDLLDAYRLGRAAAREVDHLLRGFPRGFAELVTQVRKASLSVMLNIAEGCGEYAPLEKARFYRMARRSATESVAVLDYLVETGVMDEERTRTARVLFWRTVSALIKLIQSVESRSPKPAPTPKRAPAPAP